MAASIPPFGFWPLAFVGVAVLDHALDGTEGRARFARAALAWLALFAPTMVWMVDMTVPGYIIAVCFYAAALGAATLAAPRGIGRYLAIPGALILVEWARWRWPFGGVPLSNLATGQVTGPFAPILRLGGALLVVGVTLFAGISLAAAAADDPQLVLVGDHAPAGLQLDLGRLAGGTEYRAMQIGAVGHGVALAETGDELLGKRNGRHAPAGEGAAHLPGAGMPRVGDDRLLARLRLPAAVAGRQDRFVLHGREDGQLRSDGGNRFHDA
jgi:hypothetical protein